MSGANEYPYAGDLTDERISGMLHSTLERLARRTAQNNTYITNINESGPEEALSSPSTGSFCVDPNNDPASSSQLPRYSWSLGYGSASGRFSLFSTGIPSALKIATNSRYRRNEVTPDAVLTREGTGQVACQNKSMQIHETSWVIFSGSIAEGSTITGNIIFNLPANFKGFKPAGIELDMRPQAVGVATGKNVSITTTIYKPHCATTLDPLATDTQTYVEETAPAGVEAIPGTADSFQHDTTRFSSQTLGAFWQPQDTVRLLIDCTSDNLVAYTSLSLYVGVLKVNYKT